MADKFEDLRTYVTIVEAGGVNAAASELGIAKSAASRRLADLEARLGVTLISRTTRSFEVTAVGREYFRRANEILDTLAALDGRIGSPEAASVSIAAPRSMLIHLVAPALAGLAKEGQDLPIRLVEAGGDADVVIFAAGEGADVAGARELGRSKLVVCASPDHLGSEGGPASPVDLFGSAVVSVEGAGPDSEGRDRLAFPLLLGNWINAGEYLLSERRRALACFS